MKFETTRKLAIWGVVSCFAFVGCFFIWLLATI